MQELLGKAEDEVAIVLIAHLPSHRCVRGDDIDISMDGRSIKPVAIAPAAKLGRGPEVHHDKHIVEARHIQLAPGIPTQLQTDAWRSPDNLLHRERSLSRRYPATSIAARKGCLG